jgi:hypothetical protein
LYSSIIINIYNRFIPILKSIYCITRKICIKNSGDYYETRNKNNSKNCNNFLVYTEVRPHLSLGERIGKKSRERIEIRAVS